MLSHPSPLRYLPWVLLGALAIGCKKSANVTERPVIPVRARVVEPMPLDRGLRFSATVEPATRVDLAFKVGGYVRELTEITGPGGTKRRLQEGDRVKKDTQLAVVRESDYAQKVAGAEAAVAEAVAAEKQDKLDFDRAERLVATDSVSKAQLEGVSAKLEVSRARVARAKAAVAEARLALNDCILRAPMDGVLLKKLVEVGSLVGPGSGAFVLADTTRVKVVFAVPDLLLERLKTGAKVGILLEAVPGAHDAVVTRVAPSADPRSRSFEIEATLDNRDERIRPGMIASLHLPSLDQASSGLLLPLTAVVRAPDDARGFSVYVLEGSGEQLLARRKNVTLGNLVGNSVMVTQGLGKEDRVVFMGATLLHDGDPVRVIP